MDRPIITAKKDDESDRIKVRHIRPWAESTLAFLTPPEARHLSRDLDREAAKAEPKGRLEVMLARKTLEEAHIALEFWSGLVDHHHGDKGEELCEREDCYEAWHEYPEG